LLGYAEDNIFNEDESEVFYRQLSTLSLIENGETCKGEKKSKKQSAMLQFAGRAINYTGKHDFLSQADFLVFVT
jgi:hypothetical protein